MISKVIIPVAGLGTRFLPATKAQPKEMLPIIDKPVIQYLVEEAAHSGISDVIFITGRGKRAIEDHFDFSPELEAALLLDNKKDVFKEVRSISKLARFSYVRQNSPRGDGDAILCAEHLIGRDEPVGVLFGDDVVDSRVPCLLQMEDVFDKYGDVVLALDTVPRNEVKHYGVVKAVKVSKNVYEIKDIVEKPNPKEAPSNLIIVGKYIITPSVFEELRKLKRESRGGEVRMADALKNLLKRRPIYGLQFEGTRYDCGNKMGFLRATVDFALKHPSIKKELRKYLKKVVK
ncbi:MAG: UTP--glucose-1-phosphate uridylyltransferase [Candidatus Liptonbacteria bacterium RIFCSPLOWO2_01_FULL_56_20]|uniref:UTP--glucose-1-phosphate uridylyltransferase n=1 Tax=Candidatus Liptonbacteria bacterium RIFCSPLOWO2_01_FULL_56_20 TaxID=1798652 RepID=A0A1G2CMK1_9BACT|nr:MAG: UTP-glucose-1-phosphate uridylyltransferase [Parcubacteria group bacterium GW2011_GWB1_56_8]OGY98440.1 MAG: UTP--glucose-1-phosphate uridylyltransferase [Candidatus Liptonbacteria bacterium RIFCSPHIGHO2_01_FULL_56_18b]OGZ01678.1 MAG: UTP--glucose-1-phosphate uridylyltransferase [Candidatus Liptonbacteria bacterium RIFCSPLOWO2_01_FULL_56_20]